MDPIGEDGDGLMFAEEGSHYDASTCYHVCIIFCFPSSLSNLRPSPCSRLNSLCDIMADFVSEKKISEFQHAFFHFAHEKTGVLKAKQMGEVMRFIKYLMESSKVYLFYLENLDKTPLRQNCK